MIFVGCSTTTADLSGDWPALTADAVGLAHQGSAGAFCSGLPSRCRLPCEARLPNGYEVPQQFRLHEARASVARTGQLATEPFGSLRCQNQLRRWLPMIGRGNVPGSKNCALDAAEAVQLLKHHGRPPMSETIARTRVRSRVAILAADPPDNEHSRFARSQAQDAALS